MFSLVEILLQGFLISVFYVFSIEKNGTIQDLLFFTLFFYISYYIVYIFDINPDVVIGAFLTRIIVNFMDKL